MKRSFLLWLLPLTAVLPLAAAIPLPEHPRPDFERSAWINLNGTWAFRFDAEDIGEQQGWSAKETEFAREITVPFPWGSTLSGVDSEGDLAWYRREITVPADWKGQQVYVVVGASDWQTTAWLDGELLGKHRGGYTPFSFNLTPHVQWGKPQTLVFRVDDRPHPFKLEGKQGYGPAKGIWQTVYLEARPEFHLETLHFVPDIDAGRVRVRGSVSVPPPAGATLSLRFRTGEVADVSRPIDRISRDFEFDVPIPNARWWSLDDPFLYEVEAELAAGDQSDRVNTYFGMRKISVVNLPGTDFPYIALNNEPVYIESTLDQAYHPDGFYTWPSDAFMRDEILRTKRLGLNSQRIHVKIDLPRKLYWADKLGVLLMCDVPNSWGQPDPEMRFEVETALRGMIRRDFNHPSIFSWVPFNETWGLFTRQGEGKRAYLPETQEWVASIYRLAKELDPTRLVEDNSPCNLDHVETDINSWHAYLPGYAWADHLAQVTGDTFPGSKWNFIGDRVQGRQPLFNSECGNVWGYEGSTGDCDWSWDYHIMMNEFRQHPQVCGWLYTEHHDVINEWNGYYRYDRSDKVTGLGELVSGMTLRDLHGPFYISAGSDLCVDAAPGSRVEIPLWASFMTGSAPDNELVLRIQQYGWDSLGRTWALGHELREVPFKPWMSTALKPLKLKLPDGRGLMIVAMQLETRAGLPLHRNFTTIRLTDGPLPRDATLKFGKARQRVLRFAPASFASADWSLKQWPVLDGLKVNGAGHGFFEYRLPWPKDQDLAKVVGASLVFEASAKQLFGKDREGAGEQEGDFMRGRGTHDPSLNPNAYPMTDTVPHPSEVRVRVNGQVVAVEPLPDDPADHRGILSWHAQPRDRRLREAGSYGYLVNASIPAAVLRATADSGEVVIRLEVDPGFPGGLAIYGENFGRYPVEPALVLNLR